MSTIIVNGSSPADSNVKFGGKNIGQRAFLHSGEDSFCIERGKKNHSFLKTAVILVGTGTLGVFLHHKVAMPYFAKRVISDFAEKGATKRQLQRWLVKNPQHLNLKPEILAAGHHQTGKFFSYLSKYAPKGQDTDHIFQTLAGHHENLARKAAIRNERVGIKNIGYTRPAVVARATQAAPQKVAEEVDLSETFMTHDPIETPEDIANKAARLAQERVAREAFEKRKQEGIGAATEAVEKIKQKVKQEAETLHSQTPSGFVDETTSLWATQTRPTTPLRPTSPPLSISGFVDNASSEWGALPTEISRPKSTSPSMSSILIEDPSWTVVESSHTIPRPKSAASSIGHLAAEKDPWAVIDTPTTPPRAKSPTSSVGKFDDEDETLRSWGTTSLPMTSRPSVIHQPVPMAFPSNYRSTSFASPMEAPIPRRSIRSMSSDTGYNPTIPQSHTSRRASFSENTEWDGEFSRTPSPSLIDEDELYSGASTPQSPRSISPVDSEWGVPSRPRTATGNYSFIQPPSSHRISSPRSTTPSTQRNITAHDWDRDRDGLQLEMPGIDDNIDWSHVPRHSDRTSHIRDEDEIRSISSTTTQSWDELNSHKSSTAK